MEFDDMLKVGAAAILRLSNDGWELLSARRTEPPAVAGLWEFPGGKIEADESAEDCIRREVLEELGVRVRLHEQIIGPLHDYWWLSERIAFTLWLCTIDGDAEPQLLEDHDALLWLSATQLETIPWIPADLPLVRVVGAAMLRADASGTFPTIAE